MSISFTITGPPRTKKNSEVLNLRGPKPRKMSSKAYQEWNASAQMQIALFRARNKQILTWDRQVNCKALFYRHADVGDAVGFYQALADALQEGGILVNDRQIVSWDGSRMLKDAENPRVELTIKLAEE